MPPKTPYDTNALIKQTQDMLKQTAEQGTTAFAGSTYDTPASRTGAVPAITPASMAPVAPVQVQTTPTTPVPVVTPYEPVLTTEETQAETQQTDLQKMIAGLTAETSDPFVQDARLKAEQAQGIADKKAKVASFQNINTALQAEAQGIDLQLAQDIQGLQNMAQQGGANVTKGGLAPQQRALQTQAQQAKLAVAIKQYQNNASLAASQGDLASALDYVDRAIQAEFLPKEKALAVAQANLTNLQNSGVLKRADQKRADARQKQLDAEKEALATEKQNAETIQGLILQAQQNGAPDALIQQARKGKDIIDVAMALGGYTSRETDAEIRRYNEAKKTGFKGSFLDYQKELERAKLLGKVPVAVKTAIPSTVNSSGQYKSDLDAMVGNTFNLITSKFGQESFASTIKSARNDSDKLTAIATIALGKATADERKDFVSQAQGVKNIEKAIAMLDEGIKTGRVEQGKQYLYNLAGGDFDPKLAQLNQYITSAIQPYRTSITGAAWGEQEDAEYKQLFGSSGYTPEALKTRLLGLKDILTSKSSTALQAYVSPLGVFGGETNPFSSQMNDPYGSYRSQLGSGEILVNRNGRMMAVTQDELLDTDEQL